jgi:hypothetical protein
VAIIDWYPQLWNWAAEDGSIWALAVAGLVSVFSLLIPATLFVWAVAAIKLLGRGAAAGYRRWHGPAPH